jgi:2-polyprenyl-6-methoxyphenol hydroxylase-like FAD-dependent oxidoreductase
MAVAPLDKMRAAHVEVHRKEVAAAREMFAAQDNTLPRAPPAAPPASAPPAFPDSEFFLSPHDDVCVSRNALFSAAQCAAVIAEAEAVAAADGGWSTTRHKLHPAADMPLSRLPDTCKWLAGELRTSLGPLLAARFPDLLPDARALLPIDAFVVKYAAAVGQVELPMHRDGALLTVNVALNPFDAYSGGGTWVRPPTPRPPPPSVVRKHVAPPRAARPRARARRLRRRRRWGGG